MGRERRGGRRGGRGLHGARSGCFVCVRALALCVCVLAVWVRVLALCVCILALCVRVLAIRDL